MIFDYIRKRVASNFSNKKREVTLFNKEIGDIKKYCESWNLNNPLDRWWRKKYKIPFGSKEHLSANFIDMYIEFKEDELFKEINNAEEYIPNKGKFIRKQPELVTEEQKEQSFEDFKEQFSKIDLSKYDD